MIEQMLVLKASRMVDAGEWLVELGNLAPLMVVGAITRFIAHAMHQLPQQSINTFTSNVPGPPLRPYCLGRSLLDIMPCVPTTQGVRTGTSIISYNEHLTFGVTGDYDSMADDLGVLAKGMAAGISELYARATSGLSDRG